MARNTPRLASRVYAAALAHVLQRITSMKHLLIVFALLACACESPGVWSAPSLATHTDAAVAMWNAACPGLGLARVDDIDASIAIVWHQNPDNLAGSNKDGVVWIDPKMRDRESHIPAIIAHELGHILGAEHSSDPRDLMYPTVPVDALTPADAAQVCP